MRESIENNFDDSRLQFTTSTTRVVFTLEHNIHSLTLSPAFIFTFLICRSRHKEKWDTERKWTAAVAV